MCKGREKIDNGAENDLEGGEICFWASCFFNIFWRKHTKKS